MRITCVVLAAALLGSAAVGQPPQTRQLPEVLPLPQPSGTTRPGTGTPEVLPLPRPSTPGSTSTAPQTTGPVVPGDAVAVPGHPIPCEGEGDSYKGLIPMCHSCCCLQKLCAFFTYCPCRTTLEYKRNPYNPQPPLYVYFLYPPTVDGPGHHYYCPRGCWCNGTPGGCKGGACAGPDGGCLP
jgi:hypothetical protein